ncbi:uncharacterized protein LOC142396008 [Odontesthes bonariensis]|uniref:uncharacterized protein LOC142396008 n=1 Tax=Odontesthes bonariensis TaxID=219752 RepID=UPI003F5866E2
MEEKANSLSSVLILLDLSAAFGTVNHPILLSTLEGMGVSGSALSMFSSYLTGRSYQAHIAACLADISGWMSTHHFKLNLEKTELVFLLGKGYPHRDLAITMDDSVVTSTRTARNLTDKAAQVLIQALVISRLDYCNSLLAGAPASAIRPLELVQKAAARLVFNLPKFSHTSPILRSLHWLPVAAHIQFKTLVLAYRAVEETAPSYLQAMVKPYTPAQPLRSAASRWLAAPSLSRPCARSTRSRLFSVLAPQWWNNLPTDVRTAELLPIFRRRLKTHLFRKHYPDPPS